MSIGEMRWANFRCTPRERRIKSGKPRLTFRATSADPERRIPSFSEFNKNPKASEIELAVRRLAEEHYASLLSPRYALPSSILFRFTFPIASLSLRTFHSFLFSFLPSFYLPHISSREISSIPNNFQTNCVVERYSDTPFRGIEVFVINIGNTTHGLLFCRRINCMSSPGNCGTGSQFRLVSCKNIITCMLHCI